MAKNYYALAISPNMSTTLHGYLICENVPICRSGYQEYLGKELIGMPGYEPEWNLDEFRRYRVYRPPKEVLHPDTIKSFEGNSVVDEHPDGSVVHVENDQELSCGHIEKVRQGPDHDGEVTLVGDLHIKNPDLIRKIKEQDIRDVSCGYVLKLYKTPSGSIEMRDIRGNHVAVVERGRAGPRIAILDSDSTASEIKPRKVFKMSILERIFGAGIQKLALDGATPEELAEASRAWSGKNIPLAASAVEVKPTIAVDSAAEAKPAVDAHGAAAHAALDRCLSAMKDANKMGCDAFGKKTSLKGLKDALDAYMKDSDEDMAEDAKPKEADKEMAEDGKVEELAEDGDMKKDDTAEDAKSEEKDEEDKMAEDQLGEATDKIDDLGDSVLHAGNKVAMDSMKTLVKSLRPQVAAIAAKPTKKRTENEKVLLDSYNSSVRAINAGGNSAYKIFSVQKQPEKIRVATDASSAQNFDVQRFYEGVPYNVGKKKHDEYLAQKGGK